MSELFDAVLARGGAREATSDHAWLAALLDVEAALAGAAADAGAVSHEEADAVAAACRPERFDVATLGAEAAASGNPVVPLVAALRAAVPEAAGAVHYGATSQDVVDTALMLVTRSALAAIRADLRAAASAAAGLAREHRDTPAAGRTLLQQAAPITVGLRAAGWCSGLDGAVAAVDGWTPAVQYGGAVGTLAASGDDGVAVRAALARRLDLAEPALAWHTERGRIAALAGALGRAGVAVGSVATDLVLLASTEVGEVREDVPGRGGSSTLPHKRNPVAAVSARAAAIATPGLVASVLTAASGHEYERAAGAWHAEWGPLRELLRTAGSSASWLADGLGHLVVDPSAVAAALDATGGLLLAEHARTSLQARLGDGPARSLVAAAVSSTGSDGFGAALLRAASEAGVALSPEQVEVMLDPSAHVGRAAALVDDYLGGRS